VHSYVLTGTAVPLSCAAAAESVLAGAVCKCQHEEGARGHSKEFVSSVIHAIPCISLSMCMMLWVLFG
jgi:hypothetical protein